MNSIIKLFGHKWSAPSHKVRLLLFEMNQAHEYIEVDLLSGEQYKEPFKSLNPLNRVPVLLINDNIISESNTICRYLTDKFQCYDLYPMNLEDRACVDKWIEYISHHVNNHIGKLLWNLSFAPLLNRPSDALEIKYAKNLLTRGLRDINAHLLNYKFFGHHVFSLADIAALPFCAYLPEAGINLDTYPGIKNWLSEAQSRPSWSKLEKVDFKKIT